MRTTKIKLILPLLGLLMAGSASAERKDILADQPPIRHKVEMRKLRFEVTPQFMVSMNQDFKHFLGASLVLQFHLSDWLGIGVQGAFGGGVNSELTGRLKGVLPGSEMGPQPSVDQFEDHLATITANFSAYLALTPVAGKMAILGALFLKYDLYAMLGFGGMLLSNGMDPGREPDSACRNNDPNKCDPSNAGFKPGAMFGVGTHLYFNDWFGINMEIRDILAATNPSGLDVNGDRKVDGNDETVSNNLFFTFGITLMLPPTANISP
jgi:outer membrane beta-barrel protein